MDRPNLFIDMTLTTHNDDHGQTHRLYTHYNDRTLEVFSGYNYGTM